MLQASTYDRILMDMPMHKTQAAPSSGKQAESARNR